MQQPTVNKCKLALLLSSPATTAWRAGSVLEAVIASSCLIFCRDSHATWGRALRRRCGGPTMQPLGRHCLACPTAALRSEAVFLAHGGLGTLRQQPNRPSSCQEQPGPGGSGTGGSGVGGWAARPRSVSLPSCLDMGANSMPGGANPAALGAPLLSAASSCGGRPFEARGAARTPALCPVVGSPPPVATGRHPATLHHPTLRPALKRVQVGVGGGPLCCGTPAGARGALAGPGVQG